MFNNLAFIIGVWVMIVISVIPILSWILGILFRVKTKQISFLSIGGKNILINKKIKSIELILGWLPLGTSFVFQGRKDEIGIVEQETEDRNTEFDFDEKPKWIQWFLVIFPSFICVIIGLVILVITSNSPVLDIFITYFKASFFLLSIEAVNDVFAQAYHDWTFLLGCVFMGVGFFSTILNFSSLFSEKAIELVISLLLHIFSLFLSLTFLRILWENYTVNNILLYLLGIFVTGVIFYIITYVLVKLLPELKA